MSALTKTTVFNRPALHPTVPTPVNVTLLAVAEGSPLHFTNGVLIIQILADADERSDVANIGTLFRVELTPAIDASGAARLDSLVTPVMGDGTDAPAPGPTPIAIPHLENMDTWMTEHGRLRQDYKFKEPPVEEDELWLNGMISYKPFFEIES